MELSAQEFTLVIILGGAMLALWIVARFPKVGPSTLWTAAAHVAVAFVAGTQFLHAAPGVLRSLPFPDPTPVLFAIVVGTLPAVIYLFTSLAWLIRNIQRLVGAYR